MTRMLRALCLFTALAPLTAGCGVAIRTRGGFGVVANVSSPRLSRWHREPRAVYAVPMVYPPAPVVVTAAPIAPMPAAYTVSTPGTVRAK